MKKYNEKAISCADETLELLYKNDDISLDPYFFTRLESRLEENESWGYIEKFKLKYLIPIFLIIFLLFNLVTFYKTSEQIDFTGNSEQDSISTFIRAYNLYDF